MDERRRVLPPRQMVYSDLLSEPIIIARTISCTGYNFSAISMCQVALIRLGADNYHLYIPNMLRRDEDIAQYINIVLIFNFTYNASVYLITKLHLRF